MKRKLILANGEEFIGNGFGGTNEVIAELVFETSMVGYQEILSDPSYYDQMVVMTYPLIGNYGITDEDYESKLIGPKAFIVREYNVLPSNFRYTKTLSELLEENNIPGICRIDSRRLARIIRKEGAVLALLTDETTSVEEGLEKIKNHVVAKNQVASVSCKKIWYSRCSNPKFNVVAIDCGIQYSIVKQLNNRGCNVIVVPYNTDMDKILAMKPSGIIVSNGPGNPHDVAEVVELIKGLQGKLPIFGIALGHLLIALANGLSCSKMKFGHHGCNHPVKNLSDNTISVVGQNHDYVVDGVGDSKLTVTHINLLDNTIEGLENIEEHIFSVQFQPEGTTLNTERVSLYDKFICEMESFKGEIA